MTLLLNHQDQPTRAKGAMICHFSENCIDHAVEANIQFFFNPDSILKLRQTNNQTCYKASIHEKHKPAFIIAHFSFRTIGLHPELFNANQESMI